MRRRTLYYLFNIIFPCLWLTVLSLLGFWLPPDSGEKITLGITVLLAFSVFMLLIAENMPATSEFVPLIGKEEEMEEERGEEMKKEEERWRRLILNKER